MYMTGRRDFDKLYGAPLALAQLGEKDAPIVVCSSRPPEREVAGLPNNLSVVSSVSSEA